MAIPKKFNKLLTLKEIPTNNRVVVIDNYSPNYNYIVEGHKIYSSPKGKDQWKDISDNDVARKNLHKFLKTKYNYKGYEDYEWSIGQSVSNGTYNYSTDYLKTYQKSPQKTNINQKKVQHKPKQQTQYRKPYSNPQLTKLTQVQPIKETPKVYQRKDQSVKIPLKSKTYTPPKKKPSTAKTAVNLYNNRYKLQAAALKAGYDVVKKKLSEAADYLTMGKNYANRQIQKQTKTDPKSKLVVQPQYNSKNTKYAMVPQSYTGDTIFVPKSNQYILPESIDLNNTRLGVRNRGNNSPINTEGAIITNFNPYTAYEKVNKKNKQITYMGIDKYGRFKVGNIDNFGPGDMMTMTFGNKIVSFAKDKNGVQLWKDDGVHGNKGRNVPVMNIMTDQGNVIKGSLNILSEKGNTRSDTYGWISGGRVVLQAGNETRLVSGSIDDIEKQLLDMKKRHNVPYVTAYTLDNGSYNRGLRTKNKVLTKKDLHNYDLMNNGGGNFMYIINKPYYSEKFVQTPNIRTKESDSYKNGHGLINERQGVVLHHTAFMGNDISPVVRHLTRPNGESAHVVIGFNGERVVLAKPSQVTFHAGYSRWNNKNNVNDFMIGIEFQGDTNKKNLTQDQINSAIEYLLPILRDNNITLENITTHEHVRNLYNEYAKMAGDTIATGKPDINYANYVKMIKALKQRLYYQK